MYNKLDILGAIGYLILISLATYVGIVYGFTDLVYKVGSLAWCFVTMLLFVHTLRFRYTNIIAGGGALMAFATFVAELMGQNTSLKEWHVMEAIFGVSGMVLTVFFQWVKSDKK